jgi:hypothetical protein
MAWREREGLLNFIFLADGRVEDETLTGQKKWGT